MSSYPYALDWADEHLPAVVWTSHGGQETGRALAAVLLGEAEPAGRLPQTWYRGDDDAARTRSTTTSSRRAGPTSTTGRRRCTPSATACPTPTSPTATSRLSAQIVTQDGSVDVSVTLANTGARPGSEVVQLYVRALRRPLRRRPGCGSSTSARSGSNRARAGA